MKWRRGLRYLYLRFIRLPATPASIARGFAIGVFWGMFTLPGVQTVSAVLTAALFRSDKLAAAAGTWLSNPLTSIPMTILNFEIGRRLLGREPIEFSVDHLRSIEGVSELGSDFATSYLLGCLVAGLVAAPVFYLLGLPLLEAQQRRVAARRAVRRREKLSRAWMKEK